MLVLETAFHVTFSSPLRPSFDFFPLLASRLVAATALLNRLATSDQSTLAFVDRWLDSFFVVDVRCFTPLSFLLRPS